MKQVARGFQPVVQAGVAASTGHVGETLMATEQVSRLIAPKRLPDATNSAGDPLSLDFPDQQLAEQVRQVVLQTGRLVPGRFTVACGDGVVCLRGEAPNWHAKQLAQESARQVGGVRHILNELMIAP